MTTMILFCNKAKKKTTFQLAYNEEMYISVNLVDEYGKVLIEPIKDKTLNIESLEKGTYFLRFHTTTANFTTRKITIE